MKFDLNKMGVRVGRRYERLLPAGNVRLFSKVMTSRLRRVDGSNPRGFLSSQFGNRFDSVNARLRAGERVYKQPGRFFRNTTIKSITEVFMSFKTSQFVQHLRFVLNELRSKDNVPAGESARVERVMISRFSDRRELRSASSTSVSMLYVIQQPRSDYFQAITPNALSQLALTTATTQQFQCETFAPVFALTKTQLKSESYGRYLTSLRQSTTNLGRSAVMHPQTIVHALGVLSSAHKSGSQVMNERSLINLISQHRDRSGPTIVSNRSMTFSSHAKRIDLQRFQKTLVTLSLRQATHDAKRIDSQRFQKTLVTLSLRQATHERILNRSESWFARFLTENSFFKDSQISRFISRYRISETDRTRQKVAERTFARKEAGRLVSSNDFVFAQAHRQEPADERVAKKIEAREIVEIVRKELKQSMNALTPVWNFTRRDYEEIGDQVYSSLVRRLTIERERLGLT